jgi:hypothetical protein
MSDVRLVATNPDDGTLVPVASNSAGQLAVQSPSIEKVPNDLDVEGNLTVSGSATLAGGNITLDADGDGTFTGTLKARQDSASAIAIGVTQDGIANSDSTFRVDGNGKLRIGANATNSPSVTLDADGKGIFSGDVVVGSRSKNWMLVEQGGLCHMVEQTRSTAGLIDAGFSVTEYPKLRDVLHELDLVEQALNTVMEKLRLTPPAGWEVWDGSDNL